MDVVVPFSRRWTPKAAELLHRPTTPANQRPLQRRYSDQDKIARESLQSMSVEAVRRMHQVFKRNEASKNYHYEAMIERFQLRHLKSLPITETNRDLATGGLSRRNSMDQIPHGPPESTATTRKASIPSMSRRTSHNNSSCENTRNHIVRTSVTELMSPALRVSDDKPAASGEISEDEAARKAEARSVRKRKMIRTARRLRNELQCPMSPYSMTACVRHSVVLVVLVLYLLRLPMELAFPVEYGQRLSYISSLTKTVLLIDFALNFNTAFINEQGDLVTDRKFIMRNYLTGWALLDLLSTFSICWLTQGQQLTNNAWVEFLSDGTLRLVRFVRLIWIIHVLMVARARLSTKGVAAWLLYSRHSHLLRILWMLLLIMLLSHYMACAWKVLESPATVMQDIGNNVDAYASSFYDALQLLHGQGLPTDTLGQNLFATMSVLVGSVVLAVVFGHVAILVSNFNANSTNYQRKMESVFAVMTKIQLPVLLRERIHQYYEHLWREYESLDGQLIHFSKELTHTLELEVVLFKYMEVVMQIPFWHDSSPDFLKQIVLQIQVRVYLPDDYILRRGEVGDEYYIINRGICEMIRGDDSVEHATICQFSEQVIEQSQHQSVHSEYMDSQGHASDHNSPAEPHQAMPFKPEHHRGDSYRPNSQDSDDEYGKFVLSMSRGQSFGELALLTNYPRTSNARAITYVEMCVLCRRDFQAILLRHPEDRRHVLKRMLLHTMENNEALGVKCPLLQAVRSVYAENDDDPVTVATASTKIMQVINPDLEDGSIMFGIGTNLKRDLAAFRDRGAATKQEILACNSSRSNIQSARSNMSTARPEIAITSRILTEAEGSSSGANSLSPLEQISDLEVAQRDLLRLLFDMRTNLVEITRRQDFVHANRPTISLTIPVIDYIEAPFNEDDSVMAPPLIKPTRRLRPGVRRTHSAPSKTPETPIRLFKRQRENSYSETKPQSVKKRESLTRISIKRLSMGIRRIASNLAEYQGSLTPFTDQLFQRKSNPVGLVVLEPIDMASLTDHGSAYANRKSATLDDDE